ncbi:unnamed protein product [Rotaria socialis]|uniref:DDE Tnp4 domain-containing protein n=1 Tax=Rotaria socialis TaxID=392032 RepID=A0A821Q0I4_9BILA|nr:unnamed protein product [Rotaria socialis]
MMTKLPCCINCGRIRHTKNRASKQSFRTISNKKHRWLHDLLLARGVELESEMIKCNQCRAVLCRERNHRGSKHLQVTPGDDYDDETDDSQEQFEHFDLKHILITNVFGNGDDDLYCSWCMKTNATMMKLTLSERISLLLEDRLYTSRKAMKCSQPCCTIPHKRSQELTKLSAEQNTHLLSENDTILHDDDYVSWTGWSLSQLKDMTTLVAPYMRTSTYRTPFDAVCLFWVKLKTNLSFRQIGTLFKITTSEDNIRRPVEDTLHAVTTYLNNTIVSNNLGVAHLTRIEALAHHTSYSGIFFGDQLSMVWDDTYVYCYKSNDHVLQRECYSGHKSSHLVKMMSLVLPDGYVLDLIGSLSGKSNDSTITKEILSICANLQHLCQAGDVQIVDRGFRVVAEEFETLGYDVKIPGLLGKNDKQLNTTDANESRLVTKCRWVVESFHARFKKWRFFSEQIDQSFLLNIGKLTRIVAACLNKYRSLIHDANSDEHKYMAQRWSICSIDEANSKGP